MAKAHYEGPADALELYEKLVATNPDVERKGAKNPYTSRNGHMFSFLGPDGELALRLPKEMREEFLEKFDSHIVESYGRQMKEYVAVPDDLLASTKKLKKWFDASHDHIGTLKPKPTTRPKKK